jgi:hypothetical protein
MYNHAKSLGPNLLTLATQTTTFRGYLHYWRKKSDPDAADRNKKESY